MKLILEPTGEIWEREWTPVYPVQVVVRYEQKNINAEVIGYWRGNQEDLLISTIEEYGGYFQDLGLYLMNLNSRSIKSIIVPCPMEVNSDSIQKNRK